MTQRSVTRAEIVASMAAAGGWTNVVADRALRALLASIRGALRRGQSVTLVGFGTFSAPRRRPRRGKNPRTGRPMQVTAGRTLHFKPSRDLKRSLR